MKTDTGAVVVAAGLSSRMKDFKPLLPLGDSTIIRTVISRLRSAGVSTIAVVAGYREESLREHLAGVNVDFLRNAEYATTDMFRSACIGLAYMKDRAARVFFLPGDVPLFAVRSLSLLSEAMDHPGTLIAIPSVKGRKGHPVLLDHRALSELTAYEGGEGLKGAMAIFKEATRIVEIDDKGLTLDADSPEDYRRLLQYYEEESRPAGRVPGR